MCVDEDAYQLNAFEADEPNDNSRSDLDKIAIELVLVICDPDEPRDHFTYYLDRWLRRHRSQLIKYLDNSAN